MQQKPVNLHRDNWIWVALIAACLAVGIGVFFWPVYILLALIAILGGVVLFRYPKWLIFIFVVGFPFIAGIPRGKYGIPGLKLDEILIIAGIVLSFISPAIKKRFRFTSIDAVYLTMFLVGSVLPVTGQLLRGWNIEWLEIISLLKGYFIYRLILLSVNRRDDLNKITFLLLLPSVFVVLVAVLQLMNIGNIRTILANIYESLALSVALSGSWQTFFRATSTFGNWNALGGYAAFGVLFTLALGQLKSIPSRTNLMMLFSRASFFASMLLAGSSTSFVGLFLGFLVWWRSVKLRIKLTRRSLAYLSLVVVIGSIAFFVAGQKVLAIQLERQTGVDVYWDKITGQFIPTYGLPTSLVVRWSLTKYLVGVLQDDKVAFFTGFGDSVQSRDLLPWGTPESGYFTMWFFYGPLYVVLYLVLLLVIAYQAKRIKKQAEPGSMSAALSVAGLSLSAAMAIMNLVSFYYTYAGVSHFFWVVIGCMMASDAIDKASRSEKPESQQLTV